MLNFSVITDKCIKDMLCIPVCQKKAIHPKKEEPNYEGVKQLFINPKKCQSCGSCIAACQSGAIFAIEDLPEELRHFADINAAYYKKPALA
jgi:ferredoxin--NADP+ reductase